ncbi:TetR/AcrR family transcriptional regulator [Sneathiella marina]|uniref:TetR/AcrR family transcriptional regulator n=1 Tax=Sneathiella marina TaxID=2950108 RepID=A0ABY4W602_9PROT|nr:TetR/AcrR family transcriptional regulator [Sneathiella marina]USG62478.1 TetR/AcrR family transcriptional regulator [Sneathiella marina]
MANAVEKRRAVRMAPEDRMREIEVAARSVFSRRGYAAASISEIAEKAGIREGTIYKYYENKRDLLLVVVQHWYEDLIAGFMESLADVEGTQAKFRTIIRNHIKAIKASPDLSRLFFTEVRGADDYHDSVLFELNRKYVRVLTDVIEEGMELGLLRADISTTLIRDVIFGGLESHASGFLANRSEFDVDKITKQLSELIWAGMALPPSESDDLSKRVERLEAAVSRMENSSRAED